SDSTLRNSSDATTVLSIANPSAGITQFRCWRSARSALSAHSCGELPREMDITWLVRAPGRGQEMGQNPVDLGIQREADVAPADLDRVDIGAEAGFPVHDSIRPRVDRRRRHPGRGAQITQKTHLDRCGVSISHGVEEMRRM